MQKSIAEYIAQKNNYVSISLASSNLRPHMLRLAIKMGFDIVGLKVRTYGDGSKIYFQYNILPPCQRAINLVDNGRLIDAPEIARLIVIAFKENADTIIFDDVYSIELLHFIIKYCDSFIRKPKLIFHLCNINVDNLDLEQLTSIYHGIILFA